MIIKFEYKFECKSIYEIHEWASKTWNRLLPQTDDETMDFRKLYFCVLQNCWILALLHLLIIQFWTVDYVNPSKIFSWCEAIETTDSHLKKIYTYRLDAKIENWSFKWKNWSRLQKYGGILYMFMKHHFFLVVSQEIYEQIRIATKNDSLKKCWHNT